LKTAVRARVVACFFLLVGGATAGRCGPGGAAGAPYMGLDGWDVVVATVRGVSAHAATHGNPPLVKLEVHELLRGDPEADRSRALWAPPPHDIDYGTVEDNPRYTAWAATAMDGPKPGDKMILFGSIVADRQGKVFRVISWGRFPYSEAKRAWAVGLIDEHAEQRRAREAKQRAEQEALAKARAQWRAKVSADEIKGFAREAEFVGIGRIVSGASGGTQDASLDFEIREILKGTKRKPYPGDRYFVQVVVPGRVCALLDRGTDYLLFLSEKGLKLTHAAPVYPRIASGDGVVIADAAAVAAAKEALGTRPEAK